MVLKNYENLSKLKISKNIKNQKKLIFAKIIIIFVISSMSRCVLICHMSNSNEKKFRLWSPLVGKPDHLLPIGAYQQMRDRKIIGLSYTHFRYQPQVFPEMAKNCFLKNQKVGFLNFKNRWRTTTYNFFIIIINFHYPFIICIKSQLIITSGYGDMNF